MAEYIEKKAVTDEIERLKKRAEAERVLYPKTALAAKNYMLINDYDNLLSRINSLPTQEVNVTKVSPWEDLKAKFERRRRWWGL